MKRKHALLVLVIVCVFYGFIIKIKSTDNRSNDFSTKKQSSVKSADESNYKQLTVKSTDSKRVASIENQQSILQSSEDIPKRYVYIREPTIFSSDCVKNPCRKERATKNFCKTGRAENCRAAFVVRWKIGILVKSASGHSSFRDIIRSTWRPISYVDNFQIVTAFVIGRADESTQRIIDEEAERYGDILQLNISDGYRNLPHKTLGGQQWATENLNDQDYYLATDDDVILQLGGIVDFIRKWMSGKEKDMWPEFPIFCLCEAGLGKFPVGDNTSKYFVSKEMYKWPYYPAFCTGPGLVTSVSVARKLLSESRKYKKPEIHLEDVWITGILRAKLAMPEEIIQQSPGRYAQHHWTYANVDNKEVFVKSQSMKIWRDLIHIPTCTCESYQN